MNDTIKSALYTALWAFIGLFGVSLIGFLGEVVKWADDGGKAAFPDIGVLGLAAVSAAGAAASGLVALIVRGVQAKGVLPGSPPQYPTPNP